MQRFAIIIFSWFFFVGFSQKNISNPLLSEDVLAQQKWVDSLYNSMTLKERVGQLFMIQAFSNKGFRHENEIIALIKNYNIGGIIYSKGSPISQIKMNNNLQSSSKIPLLIGMDAEWGLSMRLDSTYAFPWNMTLGAVADDKLIEKTGYQIGEHCMRVGVHFNFAPVVDINTNPNNPIIGNRSFGEDKNNVAKKASAFMKGIQSAGVLANAKHFPGHGDTDADSHKTLPTVGFSKQRIDSVELYPYRKLIKDGLSSVMVAHLNIPDLGIENGLPTSLSRYVITNVLKGELGFKGLIFTDALTMKGAADFMRPEIDTIFRKKIDTRGKIDLMAFMAGNDVLLMSEHVPKGIEEISNALKKGDITEERLAHSVKKILMAKYKVGLHDYKPFTYNAIHDNINRIEDNVLYGQLMESAITVLKNTSKILPLKNLETKTIAYVSLGDDSGSNFYSELKKYTKVNKIFAENLSDLMQKLKSYNTVVIGFHKSNANPWKPYKFSTKELTWLYEIARTNTVILDVFARPYALMDLSTIENIDAIVMSYQNSIIAQQKSAQLLFGAIPAKGKLPVSAGRYFRNGDGIAYNSIGVLSYGLPEDVGMDSNRLQKLDSIANYAIKEQMTPGMQVLVARKGKVIYSKNFGYHTYKKKNKVDFDDIYDLASLTKIMATLPLVMELQENKVLSLNTKVSKLLPEYKDTNKKDITIKQMLSHYARLKPWIPFYINTMDTVTKKPLKKWYRTSKIGNYNVEVTDKLFMRKDYKDSIYNTIKETDLLSQLRYRYSDLPYYLLKKYLEKYYNKKLDKLVQDHIYQSLGANYTTYRPRESFSLKDIVPTEVDDYFRHQKIHGYVHDMGAAMQDGVGGHSGVFSNANDVAKLMQMYLQKGFYGGKRYFKTETLNEFTKCHYCYKNNRRGVGFDKPQLGEEGPTCGCLSAKSFGHSGFTGTYTWADPEEEIVYVFLANRTYPKAGKNRLLQENIRTEIQRFIYEAIID